MKRIPFLTAASLLLCAPLYSADVHMMVETPFRAPQNIADVPGSVDVVLPAQLEQAPGATLDEKLQTLVPGLTSGRGSGLYSHGADITMRGMPGGETGQAMTLIMVDGVPLNSAATGSVQWNALKDLDIDRVEVFKGPGSSLYGSNSMAGTINIITKKAREGLAFEMSRGTYDTFRNSLRAGGRIGKLSVSASAGALTSDGYNTVPESARSATDIKSYVREKSAGVKTSYPLDGLGELALEYGWFKGRNGAGSNLTVDQYREKITDRLQASWKAGVGDWHWNVTPYYTAIEDKNVSQKSGTATYADIDKKDFGGMASVSRTLGGGLTAGAGLDCRFGVLDAHDSNNSPSAAPFSYDRGKTDNIASYLQLQGKFLGERLDLSLGLRYDNVSLRDAFTQNTSNVNFNATNGPIADKYWDKFSPKAAAAWKYGSALSQYISYSRGFRSPSLENMTLSLRRSSKYQIANPDLTPETADTVETGFRTNPLRGLYVDPGVYLTKAKDLIYYTQTTGSFYQYRNMTKVDIYGLELPVKYMTGGLLLSAAYAQSHSEVKEGRSSTSDIKGMQVTYAPRHLYSAGASYTYRETTLGATWLHKSKQYTNDTNTTSLPGYSLTSLSLTQKAGDSLQITLACDNVFNEVYTEADDELSPGRTFTGTLKFMF